MSDRSGGDQPNPQGDGQQQGPAVTPISDEQDKPGQTGYRQKASDLFQRMREAIRRRAQDPVRSLAVGTWFLAIGTWALAIIGWWALDDSRRSLETTQRAWIGPQNLHIDGAVVVDQPLTLIVDYHNTGRQPALDFFYDISPKIFTGAEFGGVSMLGASEQYVKGCISTPPSKGYSVIYPTSGFSNYSLAFEIEKELIDWNIVYGTNIITVSGCFVYNTASDVHRSSFCYYFQNGKIRPNAWAVCQTGNYAD